MEHLNKEKLKIESRLNIALKILESNGLDAQFQTQVNLELSNTVASNNCKSRSSSNSKFNKQQLLINIPASASTEILDNSIQAHTTEADEKCSPTKSFSPKGLTSIDSSSSVTCINNNKTNLSNFSSSPRPSHPHNSIIAPNTISTSIFSTISTPSSPSTSASFSITTSSVASSNSKISAQIVDSFPISESVSNSTITPSIPIEMAPTSVPTICLTTLPTVLESKFLSIIFLI